MYVTLVCSLIINLPKTRSVVADTEHPDGDNKLVLLRVQHEGAPQRWTAVGPLSPISDADTTGQVL